MSSRSREKVVAALRKLFKGRDRVEPVVTDGVNNKTKNHNHNAAAEAVVVVESPGKRLRLQDNSKRTPLQPMADSVQHQQNHNLPAQPAKVQTPTKGATTKTKKTCSHVQNVTPDISIRTRRLMKEYTTMQKSQNGKDAVYSVELVNDNLYEWHARLHTVDPDSKLAKDMQELRIQCILLHLIFPENFPFAPPFMRVVEPRIEKGFVMEGGAICMELLTPRGWASAYTVEAVLMQFAASLVKGQARIVRSPKATKEFSRRNAEASFRSLVRTHDKYGWVTPALADG